MIEPKEYFERYLTWKRHVGKEQSSKLCYESYSAMDLDTLLHEAEFGVPGALEELGERELFGLDRAVDVDRALELFQKAADAGHPDAMHMLADVYRTDQHGREDLARYFQLLPAAAERGSWKSMFNLACAYYRGKLSYGGYGYDMDHAAALEWSMRSARMCQALLQIFFQNSCTDTLKADFGDIYDTYVRAVYSSVKQYMEGDGTEQDLDRALTVTQKAQGFHKHFLGSDCDQFTFLLHKLEQAGR